MKMYYDKYINTAMASILCLCIILPSGSHDAYALRPPAHKNSLPLYSTGKPGQADPSPAGDINFSSTSYNFFERRLLDQLNKNIKVSRRRLKKNRGTAGYDYLGGPPNLIRLIRGYRPAFESIRKEVDTILAYDDLRQYKRGVDKILEWYGMTHDTLRRLMYYYFDRVQSSSDRLTKEEMSDFMDALAEAYNFALEFEEEMGLRVSEIASRGDSEQSRGDSDLQKMMDVIRHDDILAQSILFGEVDYYSPDFEADEINAAPEEMTGLISELPAEETADAGIINELKDSIVSVLEKMFSFTNALTSDICLILARTKSERAKYILIHLYNTLTGEEDEYKRVSVINDLVSCYDGPEVLSVCMRQLKEYGDEIASVFALRKLVFHLDSEAVREVVFGHLKKHGIGQLEITEFIIRSLPLSEIPVWLKERIVYLSAVSTEELEAMGIKAPDMFHDRVDMIYEYLLYRKAGVPELNYETDEFILRPIHSYKELDYLIEKTGLYEKIATNLSIWDNYYVFIHKPSGRILASMFFLTADNDMVKSGYELQGPSLAKDFTYTPWPRLKEALLTGAKKIISAKLESQLPALAQAHDSAVSSVDKNRGTSIKLNPAQKEHALRKIYSSA